MTNFKYIVRSIIHFRKQHLALFLSMTVTTAVLTGALIVGDSIRYSLNSMVSTRLGKTSFTISGGSRYLDYNLGAKLSHSLGVPVAPVLMLKGLAIKPESESRINNVNILGIDSVFSLCAKSPFPFPSDNEVVVGQSLANKLYVKVGDEIMIRVGSTSLIPVNAPFAREPVPTVAMRMNIKAIATSDQLGGLNLSNDQSAAMNIFIPAKFLSQKLNIEGLTNTFLITEGKSALTKVIITDSVRSVWSLKDLGLSTESTSDISKYDLVSNRIFLDTIAENIVSRSGLARQEVITYMVNDISSGGRHTPYSFSSAVSSSLSGINLKNSEVIINRWTAEDLAAHTGDSIKLTYFVIGPMRQLSEESHSFIIRAIIENDAKDIDRTLMPRFQGMAEAENCRDWDAGVPIDFKRIRDKDEKYWKDYRGTPKVLLSLETGRKLWANQFGSLTAVRFNGQEVTKDKLTSLLLNKIRPSDIGIQVVDVRHEGARAAENAVDFTELFISLSFFVIAAGILLTMLIYSLHFTRRSGETALLSGLGFSQKKIVWLRLAESTLVIMSGSVAGSLIGILYNYSLVAALNTVWNDIVRTNMLLVNVKLSTLITGSVAGIIIAALPVYFVTVRRLKVPLADGLKGNIVQSSVKVIAGKSKSAITGYILLAFALVLVIYSVVTASFDEPLLYLAAAGLFLAGCLMFINGILKNNRHHSGKLVPSVMVLALKNMQRNPSRSLSVVALLALGTFTLILTGSYRRTYYGEELNRKSGTGGYLLWAETTNPIPFNLNSPNGRDRLLTDNPEELRDVNILQFERLDGDDASCLNLNQAQKPKLLAVDPAVFDSSGAFSFVKLLSGITREHPWKGLDIANDKSTYPAFADQNVIQYSLKKKLGDTIIYLGESGRQLKLILAGAISNSVFQGNLLISEKVFREYFPSSGGSRTVIVDAPAGKQKALSDLLTRSLTDYGIDVTPTVERLATFNSVENTYLSVFMALSGFGFLIGTIGLGIVLLRNIFERKQELALMISLGYSQRLVFSIVFAENLILLITGFIVGLMAAITGIIPSLLSPSFNIEWKILIIITAVVFISGLIWIYLPLRSVLKKSLIGNLRAE